MYLIGLDTAVKEGEYIGETIFISKNKEKINAKIKITPTYKKGKKGEHIGYCGVSEKINDDVNVKINFTTKIIKWLAITRLPFTSKIFITNICYIILFFIHRK